MRLSWAGKLFAAGIAAKAAAAGLRYFANRTDNSGEHVITLSADQMNAAHVFAQSQGITLREAVSRLYNVDLIE